MYYVALVLVVSGYLGTVMVAWQSVQRRTGTTYWALFSILLGAFGAAWIAVDASRSTQQLSSKSDTIAQLQGKLAARSGEIAQSQRDLREKAELEVEAQKVLRQKSDKIAELNRLLAIKSDEIASLSRDIAGSVTGGGSYCYFGVSKPLGTRTDHFYLQLLREEESTHSMM
ncbi:MAG: hypothetical protein ABSH06_22740 [Thermodesulfobacteriota bacterium]|jgi:hypothetical protein